MQYLQRQGATRTGLRGSDGACKLEHVETIVLLRDSQCQAVNGAFAAMAVHETTSTNLPEIWTCGAYSGMIRAPACCRILQSQSASESETAPRSLESFRSLQNLALAARLQRPPEQSTFQV